MQLSARIHVIMAVNKMNIFYIRFPIIFVIATLFAIESSISVYSQERIRLILANGNELFSTNNGYSWETSEKINSEDKDYAFVCRYSDKVIYITPNIQITGNFQFFLFDVLGNMISENTIAFEGASNEKSVELSRVVTGFYFWILSNGLIRYSSSYILY